MPALAQEERKPTRTETRPAQSAPLTIRTSDKELAEGAAHGFQHQGELPDPKDGHFEISIDDGGKAKVTAAPGAAGYLEVVARPGALMDIYADKIDEYRGMMQAGMMMSLQQTGMKPKEAGKMVQSILDFPKQIETFEMRISSNPDHAKRDGMNIDISLVPVGGTWLADMATALKPNGVGAPQLGQDDGMISCSLSLESAGLSRILSPFMDFAIAMHAKGADESKRLAAFTAKALASCDGTMSMRWGRDGMTVITGLSDAKGYQELINNPETRAMLARLSGAGMLEVELKDKALEHRGVPALKLIMKQKEDANVPPNPLLGEGPHEGYLAVVGNYGLVSSMTRSDKEIKALIDQASDQKIKRAPLPGGAVATLGIGIAAMTAVMHGQAADDAPDRMTVALTKTQSGIGIKIHAK